MGFTVLVTRNKVAVQQNAVKSKHWDEVWNAMSVQTQGEGRDTLLRLETEKESVFVCRASEILTLFRDAKVTSDGISAIKKIK